jgi:hypothetical protein
MGSVLRKDGFGQFGRVVFTGVAHNAKLFQAVAFLDFDVGEARFAFVAHAGFCQVHEGVSPNCYLFHAKVIL